MTKPTITDEDRAAAADYERDNAIANFWYVKGIQEGLERAAVIAESHMADCLDDKDIQKRWPTIKARNDVYAAAIRAEKEKV